MTAIFDLEPVRDPAPVHRAGHEPHPRNRSGSASMGAPYRALTHRDRAILRAVDDGTAELVVGAEPDLYLDGLCCGDQFAARRLAHAGLIAAARPGSVGKRVRARLTMAGRALLAD